MEKKFKKGDAVIYRYKGFDYVGKIEDIYTFWREPYHSKKNPLYCNIEFAGSLKMVKFTGNKNIKHLTSIVK